MNSLFSNNIGYLNALRFAQPLPQMTIPATNTTVSAPKPKKSNVLVAFAIIVGGILAILAFRNYHEAQEKKNKR